VNDAGFQTSADEIGYYGFVNRRWTKPGKVFRFAFLGNNLSHTENFDRVRTGLRYNANAAGTFLNYWNVDAHFNYGWRVLSTNLTRGGPLAYSPANWAVSGGLGSDSRKRVAMYGGFHYSENEVDGWGAGLFSSIDIRPTTATTISIQPGYSASNSIFQFVQSQADPSASGTFGRRYVFSQVEQRGLDLTTRVNVTFRPNLSLQFYAQPFVATGDYHGFKELARARSMEYIVYGETGGSTLRCFNAQNQTTGCATASYYIADPDGSGPRPEFRINNGDFNARSLNGNAVLRWEYRPGSTMFFVWTTSCSAGTSDPRFSAGDDMRRLCQGPSDNVFAVKANYWLSF
jgi:hypothetical protein